MCFVWISEQTAIISLYSINWLVCITERECVYCAVRTEVIQVKLGLRRRHLDVLWRRFPHGSKQSRERRKLEKKISVGKCWTFRKTYYNMFRKNSRRLKTLFIKDILKDVVAIIWESAILTGLLPALSFATSLFAPSLYECNGTLNFLLAQNACVCA